MQLKRSRGLEPSMSDKPAYDVDRLLRCIDMAMGCLDPESKNRDEALAWYRLYDAEMGREPRPSLQLLD